VIPFKHSFCILNDICFRVYSFNRHSNSHSTNCITFIMHYSLQNKISWPVSTFQEIYNTLTTSDYKHVYISNNTVYIGLLLLIGLFIIQV
jgi:hypothetical protein